MATSIPEIDKWAFYAPDKKETEVVESILDKADNKKKYLLLFDASGIIRVEENYLWTPTLLGIEQTDQTPLVLDLGYSPPLRCIRSGRDFINIPTNTLRIINRQASGLKIVGEQSGYLVPNNNLGKEQDWILYQAEQQGIKPPFLDEEPCFKVTDEKDRGKAVELLVFVPSRWESRVGNWIVLNPATKEIIPSICKYPLSAERWDPLFWLSNSKKLPADETFPTWAEMVQIFSRSLNF